MAISAVSRSRISPTMMMSGSCRRMERSAAANVSPILGFTGICVTPATWYSTGSSTVTILTPGWFSRSSAPYSVVVFPEPVGPVTRRMPCGWRMRCSNWSSTGPGMPSSARSRTPAPRSSTRSTTLSPCRVGVIDTRMSSLRSESRRRMRPSWASRRSAMFSPAMIFTRLTTAAWYWRGGCEISCNTPSMRYRTRSPSAPASRCTSLARARSASRIRTLTSLITGAWLARARRSSIVSSSSASTTRSPPRRSPAWSSGAASDWAERIAAWISAAGASTSRTWRSKVQQSSSITVGSSGRPAATTSAPPPATARGSRQCSSRYLGESRWASGPAAAPRTAADLRAAVRAAPPVARAGVPRGSAADRSRLPGRRRHHAVDALLHVRQPLPFPLQQRVRLLVGVHDVRREEDRELGSLPAGATTLEEIAQDRNVLEDRHARLDLLGRFPDQPADHDRVPVLHDRARLRFARGNHGGVLRRGDRRRGQRAHLLQHAERDVAVIVDGGDDRQLRAHVAKLNHGVQPRRQAAEGGGHERHLASHQDARLLVVQCQHARRRQHAHVGPRGERLQDGPHVQAGEADDPHAEALEALQQRIAEALRADPDADPTGRVARNAPLRQELPVDAELAGPVEGHLGDQHFQEDLRGTDVELLDRLLEHREVRRCGTDHE